jgi:hypothetical protein
MTSTLQSFLNSHRVKHGEEYNVTGFPGCYYVPDSEYDTFLALYTPASHGSTLLEKHREYGPLLVNLDFMYATRGERRYTKEHIDIFMGEYIAALGHFVDLSKLPHDLSFYVLEKPASETDRDGIHIQCPHLTVSPQLQYAIRGYLLMQRVIERIFGPTDPTDCYDVSVIQQNNWFLYGAGKPNKEHYKITSVFSLSGKTIEIPTDMLEVVKLLSIRVGHTVPTPLVMREDTAAMYARLIHTWGQGNARPHPS